MPIFRLISIPKGTIQRKRQTHQRKTLITFQFQKVQFKVCLLFERKKAVFLFQFQKVQFKDNHGYYSSFPPNNFNSKRYNSKPIVQRRIFFSVEFQFQKVQFKVVQPFANAGLAAQISIPKGTIQSRFTASIPRTKSNFNSKRYNSKETSDATTKDTYHISIPKGTIQSEKRCNTREVM